MTHNLVFGGDGLIGRALCRKLTESGETAVSYDLKSGFDLREKQPPIPSGKSYCWFLAWDVGGAKYIMSPSNQHRILQNNVELCSRVFEWLGESKIPFTFTSTQMAGYPNAYGISKQLGEYWAQQFPRASICRLWNVYGAEPISERSHVISDLVFQALNGRISMKTNGRERRQFITAQDCAEALVLQRDTTQTFADITSGEWVPIIHAAEIVAKLLSVPIHAEREPGYESLVNPTSALRGWSPKTSLEQGIAAVIEEMRRDARLSRVKIEDQGA